MIQVEWSQIRKETAWGIMYTQPGAFTGHVMLLIMFLMYTTAHHKIRAQSFEAFWYTHHLVSRSSLHINLKLIPTSPHSPSSSFSAFTPTLVS